MKRVLQTYSETMLRAVEAELRAALRPDEKTRDFFYLMMHYQMGWVDETFRPAKVKSGKKIRPLLCLLSSGAACGSWEEALPAAAAVEIIHNFSLIHDDIVDRSETRRGRPAHWSLWGTGQALNTGDALFGSAFLALGKLGSVGKPGILSEILPAYGRACIELTRGQHLDMEFENRPEVTIDDYLDMISGKTAAVMSLCCEAGAIIAGAGRGSINTFASFGRDLGVAFQIHDDFLGIWGDEADTGKSSKSDIHARKKTLPVLYALSRSGALRDLYAREDWGDDCIAQVTEEVEKTGARDFTSAMEADYHESARKNLASLEPACGGKDYFAALGELADVLLSRKS